MKDQILKIAKVKSEKEFYKKYPSEEAFMAKHGKQLKKAAMGEKMVQTQLKQLTDFGNPPIAQNGKGIIPFEDARTKAQATILGITPEELMKRQEAEAAQANQSSGGGANDIMGQLASFITPEMMAGLAAKSGYSLSKAYDGDVLDASYVPMDRKAITAPNMSALNKKLSNPAFQKQAITNVENIKPKAGLDFKGAGMSALSALPSLIGDVQAIGERKKQKKELKKGVDVSDLVRRAAESRPIYQPNQQIVKPWDVPIQRGELYNSYGSNTNFLTAANGTQIQNTYAPTNTLYDDLGYEPLNESDVKQYDKGGKVKKAQFGIDMLAAPAGSLGSGLGSSLAGGGFKGSPEGNIGSSVGAIAGQLLIPIPGVGAIIGGALGGAIGGFIGGDEQRQMEELQNQYSNNTDLAAGQSVIQGMDQQFSGSRKDGGWVSNDWQPQVIATFGEHKVKDLLKPPYDADMLRAGGSVGSGYYTPPSAAAMNTGRAKDGTMLDSDIRSKQYLESITDNNKYKENLREAVSSVDTYSDGRPMEKTDLYSITKGRNDNQRVKEFLRSKTGDEAPKYSMQKTRKPLFGNQYKTVSKEIGAGRGERRMEDMEQFLGNMEYGGQMAMGGDLQVHEGKADTISYNPFLPKGGETVMFKGPSHANGGMDISYGQNGVEVEGGEPGVVLKDGGEVKKDESLVIYGNIKFDKTGAEQLGDPDAEGQKIKNYMNDLSKFENKQSKLREKGLKLIDETDLLKMGTVQAIDLGTTMNFKTAAQRKIDGAAIQEAYNKTSKEYGYKDAGKFIDDVRKGSVKQLEPIDDSETAQDGAILNDSVSKALAKMKTQGKGIPTMKTPNPLAAINQSRLNAIGTYGQVPTGGLQSNPTMNIPGARQASAVPGFTADTTDITSKNDKWKDILRAVSSVVPMLRPSNAAPLDPSQLSGEMLALASNQLEGVQAQSFQPMLDQPFDISLQDQINMIDSQTNAAIRAIGIDPSAQSQIMANAIEAKNRVLGEEFRMNQANKAGIYSKNRDLINQSKLANLQIFDKQYERQSQAKSNTKAQAIGALNSINSKIAQNKLENKQLGVYENLYGYRFGPNGQAYNLNGLAQFNVPTVDSMARTSSNGTMDINGKKYRPIDYDNKTGVPTKFELAANNGAKIKARNSSIVKAVKSL
tara:strand:+ start:331 stop:3804 length:3474 start_codon:yes stop_codon:yes gene_type:complete